MDIIYRAYWIKQEKEDEKTHYIRTLHQKKQLRDLVRKHGRCYLVKFGNGDIRPMWEDQINIAELIKELRSPSGMPFDCPLCQPYNIWDTLEGRYSEQKFMTKIISPKYRLGLADEDGVWIKCPCLVAGEGRRKQKFITRSIT